MAAQTSARTAEAQTRPYDDLEWAITAVADVDGVHVIGSRCAVCDTRMAGRRYACSTCMSVDLVEHRFGPAGTLYSYTKVHVSPHSAEPYILGYVDLDESVRVLTVVVGEFQDVYCDQPVVLTTHGSDWAVTPLVGATSSGVGKDEVTE